MSCGVGCGCGSDPTLLWLWRRPAAMAPIGPLAWEPPYTVGVALEKAKRQKTKIKTKNKQTKSWVAKNNHRKLKHHTGKIFAAPVDN